MQLPPPSPELGFDGLGFEFDEPGFVGGDINELEEMYKPFVVQVEEPKHESPMSSQTETTSPCSSSFVVFDHDDDLERLNEEMKVPVDLDGENQIQAKLSSKKRKSKHKRVRVVHRGVGEDGAVVMDKWNWRKYGQKAIKGSPYPRCDL
uniref:WRKY transcription factor n=1 Tax=Fagopyrum tataricum TaxID=62330 RepID=A0A4P9Q2B9_FAGTA|nr:WRKY transcription factor [Fagopyrum tataricum]